MNIELALLTFLSIRNIPQFGFQIQIALSRVFQAIPRYPRSFSVRDIPHLHFLTTMIAAKKLQRVSVDRSTSLFLLMQVLTL